jgi:hypothetical protein
MAQQESTSGSIGPDKVEQEFTETLRQAAWIFEKEKDGRFQGSIIACRAVVRFILLRDRGAELAGPFVQIAAAFEVLERGGKPRLFSKKRWPIRNASARLNASTFKGSPPQLWKCSSNSKTSGFPQQMEWHDR